MTPSLASANRGNGSRRNAELFGEAHRDAGFLMFDVGNGPDFTNLVVGEFGERIFCPPPVRPVQEAVRLVFSRSPPVEVTRIDAPTIAARVAGMHSGGRNAVRFCANVPVRGPAFVAPLQHRVLARSMPRGPKDAVVDLRTNGPSDQLLRLVGSHSALLRVFRLSLRVVFCAEALGQVRVGATLDRASNVFPRRHVHPFTGAQKLPIVLFAEAASSSVLAAIKNRTYALFSHVRPFTGHLVRRRSSADNTPVAVLNLSKTPQIARVGAR